jgi:hypothetical protein
MTRQFVVSQGRSPERLQRRINTADEPRRPIPFGVATSMFVRSCRDEGVATDDTPHRR